MNQIPVVVHYLDKIKCLKEELSLAIQSRCVDGAFLGIQSRQIHNIKYG